MSQATLGSTPYRNSSLFSGYYLDERIADLEEWECDEPAREAFEALQDIWDLEGELVAGYKEDELLDSWIDEVLDILGFGTQSETTVPGGEGFNDRLLFESDEIRRDAAKQAMDGNTEAMYGKAAAVLEAKQWDADFTRRFNEQRSYRDASHQIKYYLEHTPERLRWGILTDGKKWRLYGTKDYATEIYYEVDLPELLEAGHLEEFKYFYAFFRPPAFREVAGTTFLDTVWNESETAAQELGEDLQDNVFTALRVLGEGFIHSNDLDIDPDDEAAREELKEQSLVLLYRLMFVLYAESRGLIHPDEPAAQAEYEEHFSLDQLRLEIHEDITSGDTYDDYSGYATQMWSQLEDLFGLVDEGKDDLGIPPYNGGLFDAEEHAFLAEHEVADRYIAEVIHRLGTTEGEDGEAVLADYADLDTRHLGSIYEGLLEHEFRIAEEPYAAVAEDGGQVWKPGTEVSVAEAVETVEEGELYVVNDDGERKATGAYYTPDYVVSYIVEETVDPLLADIREELEADGLEPSDQAYFGRFYAAVQDLKILDPAMGSAHFLTSATGYLTEQVIEIVREQEQQGRDEQEIRRTIAKECIYGVDVNGMAVELGKLAMWLETLATDQPLAFLDHHLKAGNSLVGSDITEVLSDDNGGEEGQLTLTQVAARVQRQTLEHVMDLMEDLLDIDNETLADIKSMEEIYDEIRSDPLYQRLFEIANVHTAEEFGLDVPEGVYEEMAGAIEDVEEWTELQGRDWFTSAQAMAEEESFFHWELEYPEVFFGEDGTKLEGAGFDCLLGNPPWGAELPQNIEDYITTTYNLSKSANDTFACFTILANRLIASEATIGYILPSGWQTSDKYADFRQWMVSDLRIEKLVNLPYDVFADAYVDSSIFILTDINTDVDVLTQIGVKTQVINFDRKAQLSKIEPDESNSSYIEYSKWFSDSLDPHSNYEFLSYLDKKELAIEETVAEHGTELKEFADVQRGITPFDLTENGQDACAPALDGGLRRYSYYFSGDKYVEYHEDIAEYKPERYFEGERLLLRELISRQFRLQLVLTNEDFVTNKSYQSILLQDEQYDPGYLLAVLNSKPLSFYHVQRSAVALRDDFPKIVLSETRSLPIPEIDFGEEERLDSDLSQAQIILDSGRVIIDSGAEFEIDTNVKTHDLLSQLARKAMQKHKQYRELNLNLVDYLGHYDSGPRLSETGLLQPVSGINESILYNTTEECPNLRIGDVEIVRESPNTVEIAISARYKPDNESRETDRWGYVETELLPAFRITDLSQREADLIEAFVPMAIEKANGFANFRTNATKSNTLVDRVEALTLPAIGDVKMGLV